MDDNTQKPMNDDQVQGDQTTPAVPVTPVAPATPVVEEPGIEELLPSQAAPADSEEEESFEDIDNTVTE